LPKQDSPRQRLLSPSVPIALDKRASLRPFELLAAVRPSFQIELTQRLAIGSVLGLAQGLGKLLLKEVFLVLLRFD